ncbi:signal transduction histidine kinase [Striga asiatica]|uniref:Signal transduction histidine kinase n=1 Tax=Striga asiatica TaxID=4170 RepID=A0A5A7P1K7_STRAF|nr:signal transduction histidine kinase [Striga asiatica]
MKGLLHEGLDIHIRNGATVKLQDHNWVPCLRGRGPKLKDPTSNGHLWVKDLTYTDTDQWDEAKIRELVEAEDCQAILDIQSLNPHTMDKTKGVRASASPCPHSQCGADVLDESAAVTESAAIAIESALRQLRLSSPLLLMPSLRLPCPVLKHGIRYELDHDPARRIIEEDPSRNWSNREPLSLVTLKGV